MNEAPAPSLPAYKARAIELAQRVMSKYIDGLVAEVKTQYLQWGSRHWTVIDNVETLSMASLEEAILQHHENFQEYPGSLFVGPAITAEWVQAVCGSDFVANRDSLRSRDITNVMYKNLVWGDITFQGIPMYSCPGLYNRIAAMHEKVSFHQEAPGYERGLVDRAARVIEHDIDGRLHDLQAELLNV